MMLPPQAASGRAAPRRSSERRSIAPVTLFSIGRVPLAPVAEEQCRRFSVEFIGEFRYAGEPLLQIVGDVGKVCESRTLHEGIGIARKFTELVNAGIRIANQRI